MDRDLKYRLLYNISISVGSSHDLLNMLNEFTLQLKAGIGCRAVSFFEGTTYLEHKAIYTRPKGLVESPEFQVELERLLSRLSDTHHAHASFEKEGRFDYIFELQGYGFYVLSSVDAPIIPEVLEAFDEINLKLVKAIQACLDHRDLQINRVQLMESQSIAKIGSWDWNLVTDQLWWSKETYRIFDVDEGKAHPSFELFMSLVHPEDRGEVANAYRSSIETQTDYKVEHRLLTESGQVKYVQEFGTTRYDADGHAIRSYGTMQDITERKLSEQAIAQQERELNAIIEALPLMLFVKDAKHLNYVRFNKSGEKLMGACRNEFLGKNAEELMAPEQAEIVNSVEREIIRSGSKVVIPEEQVSTLYGTRILHTTKVCISDDAGMPKFLLGISEDITDRKQNESTLKLSTAVIQNLAEGIMICDADSKLIYVNPAFEQITGYKLKDVKGMTPKFLQSGKHDSTFYSQMWQAIVEDRNWQGEVWNKRADGSLIPEWLSISSIQDDRGRLTNYIAVFNDISQLKENEDQLRFLAHHDPLTELPNRVLLNERLEHALARIEGKDDQLAVIYLDLDHFKNINDSFGHPHGDQVLQQVAARLLSQVKESDTVTRVSGDEFVILVEDIDSLEEMGLIAQKLIESFNEPISIFDDEIVITTSMGIAVAPNDGHEAVQLLKNADTALYRAKDLGRNTFEFYSKDMTSASFETMFLLRYLHQAVDKNELILHYQPQMRVQLSQFTGVESLVRWEHPEMGLISPAKFIPLAEESGLIIKIGEWVLRQACSQMKKWLDQNMGIDYIAVNISGRQLMDKHFYSIVENALADADLDGCHIELEITETLIMKESNYSALLLKLKRLNIRISIDDFGTGYSSLIRLKALPIDKLKIDMSFIRGIPSDSADTTITKSIIDLAKGMRLDVIAEGVENQSQAIYLLNNGCGFAQGFFYFRPLPAHELEALIMKHKRIL